MKKTVLSLLAIASSVFGLDTVDVYLKGFNPVINNILYVGDIIDNRNNGIVVGKADCEADGTYKITFKTVNTTTNYGGSEVRKLNLPEPYKTDCKRFAGVIAGDTNKYSVLIPDEVPLKDGTKARFGTTKYFGSKNCANIPMLISEGKSTSFVIHKACFTPSMFYPEKEVPEIATFFKWDGTNEGKLKYLKDLEAAIASWDAMINTGLNSLWEDRGETRKRYSTEDVIKYGKSITRLGDFITSDGYLLFSVMPVPSERLLSIRFGGVNINYDAPLTPTVKEQFDTVLNNKPIVLSSTYTCHPSVDDPNITFGMFDIQYDGKVVMSLLAPTIDSNGFPICDKQLVGKTYTIRDAIDKNTLAIYASKPAIVK